MPLRGGLWRREATAGVFAFSLHDPRSVSGSELGFRAAFFRPIKIMGLSIKSDCRCAVVRGMSLLVVACLRSLFMSVVPVLLITSVSAPLFSDRLNFGDKH